MTLIMQCASRTPRVLELARTTIQNPMQIKYNPSRNGPLSTREPDYVRSMDVATHGIQRIHHQRPDAFSDRSHRCLNGWERVSFVTMLGPFLGSFFFGAEVNFVLLEWQLPLGSAFGTRKCDTG